MAVQTSSNDATPIPTLSAKWMGRSLNITLVTGPRSDVEVSTSLQIRRLYCAHGKPENALLINCLVVPLAFVGGLELTKALPSPLHPLACGGIYMVPTKVPPVALTKTRPKTHWFDC